MEQKDMSGVLFRNERKEKDSHPDYTGNCMINGEQFWISAWLNTSEKTGKQYMSFSFKEKVVQRQPDRNVDDGDFVPF